MSADRENATIIRALLNRLVPRYAQTVRFEDAHTDGPDFFELRPEGGGLAIAGNKPLCQAVGLNRYLKDHCGAHVSWHGTRMKVPDRPPLLTSGERHVIPFRLRPYLNYCAFGYSLAWWTWSRWQKEIDFMALNGVNMPLALTGQEMVWLRTLRRFGLTDSEITAFLSGPAFLPWQWMANMDSHAGPLPMSWIESHAELGRQIADEERAWGMTPLLAGFNGHVPEAFVGKHPNVRTMTCESWCFFPGIRMIEPSDPMFKEVTLVFMEELTGLFGTDHCYSIDLFHERKVLRDDPAYLEECGRHVFEALNAADPEAAWVMQAWTERREIIAGIPRDRLVLLDLRRRLEDTDGLYGLPTARGVIHSFGGQTQMGGDLRKLASHLHDGKKRFPNMIGAGALPESIDNNPVLFEWLFELALREEPPDLDAWIRHYVARRYGADSPDAQAAWRRILADVYSASRGDPVFAARPALDLDRANAFSGFNESDTPSRFFPAWTCLIRAAPGLENSAGYRFDVTDLGRQALSSLGLPLYRQCVAAYRERNLRAFRRARAAFIDLMRDSDRLLGTCEAFRLDTWVRAAEAWGDTAEEKAYYRWNAKLQITRWGPLDHPQALFDYCCREWHGLIAGYYLPRWTMFFERLEHALRNGEAYVDASLERMRNRPGLRANDLYREMDDFETAWTKQADEGANADVPEDTLAVANALLRKYEERVERLARDPVTADSGQTSEPPPFQIALDDNEP